MRTISICSVQRDPLQAYQSACLLTTVREKSPPILDGGATEERKGKRRSAGVRECEEGWRNDAERGSAGERCLSVKQRTSHHLAATIRSFSLLLLRSVRWRSRAWSRSCDSCCRADRWQLARALARLLVTSPPPLPLTRALSAYLLAALD